MGKFFQSAFEEGDKRSGGIIVLLLIAFSICNYMVNGFYAGMKYKGGDFLNYYVNGKLLVKGVNIHNDAVREEAARQMDIYQEGELIKKHHQPDYPPFWYLLISALTVFDWHHAFYLWTLINQIFLILALILLFKYFKIRLLSIEGGITLFIVLNYYPLFYSMMEGQVNILLLFLILWSLWLFKRRIDVAAGLLLGLAMGIKIVPGILLLYFLWKREWKVVVWSIAGFALSLIITGGIAGGGIVGSYFFTQLLKYGGGLRPEVFNQSLNGFISRLFTYSEASNGWFYSPLTANILVKALSLVILGLSLYWTRGKTERSEFEWDLGFALFLSAMLIVSTWTMEHHLVFLYFPLLILLLGYIREQGISKVYAILSVLSLTIFAIDYPTESLKFNNGVLILIKSLKFYPLLIIWMITGLALVHKHKIAINRNKI